MTSVESVTSVDSFEVIFDNFLPHIGWYLSQSHLWTKELTKQGLFLDVMATLELLEDSQDPKYDNFVYQHTHRV